LLGLESDFATDKPRAEVNPAHKRQASHPVFGRARKWHRLTDTQEVAGFDVGLCSAIAKSLDLTGPAAGRTHTHPSTHRNARLPTLVVALDFL
jgi:hypothetical protein